MHGHVCINYVLHVNLLIRFSNTPVRRFWPKRRNGRAGNWETVMDAWLHVLARVVVRGRNTRIYQGGVRGEGLSRAE